MANRTVRRNVNSVSIVKNNDKLFTHTRFKGMCDNQNNIQIDQSTFSDVLNLYVDEHDVLTSRPPLKFNDDEAYIIDEWTYGYYGFRFYRTKVIENDITYFDFTIRCYTHDTHEDIEDDKYGELSWLIQIDDIGEDDIPKLTFAEIEDKIYIWFAGIDFMCFNTSGTLINDKILPYFEDARKYLYIPIVRLFTNGIESDFEDTNFLTDTYIKRHLYSSTSSINFSNLVDKNMTVNFRSDITNNVSTHLYDITVKENQKEMLIYPYSTIGENAHVDMVSTNGRNIFLRYYELTNVIEISFNGRMFVELPKIYDILGEPFFTDDGFHLIAFTKNGIASCQIVNVNEYIWELENYFEVGEHDLDLNIVPVGHFLTKDTKAYITQQWYGATRYTVVFMSSPGGNNYDMSQIPLTNIKLNLTYFQYTAIVNILYANTVSSDFLYLYRLRLKTTGVISSTIELKHNGDFPSTDMIFGVWDKCKNFDILQFDPTPIDETSSISELYICTTQYRSLAQLHNTIFWRISVIDYNASSSMTFSYPDVIEETSIYKKINSKNDVLTENALYKYTDTGYNRLPVPDNGLLSNAEIHKPLSFVWYYIDDQLWTSQTNIDAQIELDEYVNMDNGIEIIEDIPNHHSILSENYLAYQTFDNKNLLQINTIKRDSENKNLLLYFPKINENTFSRKITNLQTVSQDEMGVFTEEEIWYVQRVITGDGLIAYTRPAKSKLPFGCRDGSDVAIALNGSHLLFTTSRGIAALAPQENMATTEQTLTYLSDNIQSKYTDFYETTVHSTMLIPDEFNIKFKPQIKIVNYQYWTLFYRYMDREILVLDSRNGSWWIWNTQYPIRRISVTDRMYIVMEVDFNPIEVPLIKDVDNMLGISFLWSDREIDLPLSYDKTFPVIEESEITYQDDVIEKTLNGNSIWIDGVGTNKGRRQVFYANPMINWSFTSQRLHFNQVNNYKQIKSISLNTSGLGVQTAKFSIKTFREFYHPEKSNVIEIEINDLRTFVKKMNIMHVINFQYKFEADTKNEIQNQSKFNAITMKYEVKEGI